MPGTVKSELLPDADRSHKCDCQEKVSWKRNLPLDKSHFITEAIASARYTFVEQMAAGIVVRLGKCGCSCGVLKGRGALRGSISDRKMVAGSAGINACQLCYLRNKGISKPRRPLFTIVSELPWKLFSQAVYRFFLHLLCPALAQMEMKRCADHRVLDSVGIP